MAKRERLMFYPVATEPKPWPTGPCGQVCCGCTLCGRGLGNGMFLALCVECGEALRDPYSDLGSLLRDTYREARFARLKAENAAGR